MENTQNTLRLSELSLQVEQVLNNAFANLQFWVIAEITSHIYSAGKGTHYFELIEKRAGTNQLLAKFKTRAWSDGTRSIQLFEQRTGQRFTNDIQVLVRVKVVYHPTFGLQLELTDIDHTFTLGILEHQRQQTLLRLCRENPDHVKKHGEEYWTYNKELPLPLVIQNIAVVTGTNSAGWQDFQHSIENNTDGFRFNLIPFFTEVQGENNATAMQDALIRVYQTKARFDAIVIIRGGGSQSDFLLFDHYLVARAIARFPVPVITGIGHQKNTTIADMMAHTSVKTPTKAAELIINHNRSFQDKLLTIQKNILIKSQQGLAATIRSLDTVRALVTNSTYQLLAHYKDGLDDVRQSVIDSSREILYNGRTDLSAITSTMSSKPKIIVGLKMGELSNIVNNLKINQARLITNSRGYLGHYISYFAAVSPENTLKRGFAVIKYHGQTISNPDKLKKGDNFTVIMQQTELTVELQDKKKSNGI
jgi:exodeoxyribonuclease VII large subunit